MSLPIRHPFAPMDALLVSEMPTGEGWQYEPKWDGFRCLVYRDYDDVHLQSKSGQPLTRYFPELVELFQQFKTERFILDGEIAIPIDRRFSFDDLLQRIHPAESRVRKLAKEHPALFIAFDLLVGNDGKNLLHLPLRERRRKLEQFAKKFFPSSPRVRLSPATEDPKLAKKWFERVGNDLDGIVAKKLDCEYRSGERDGMEKIKLSRTADCVIGGFRYAAEAKVIGSLLLGLYDDAGLLNHVGFCSGLKAEERKALVPKLAALIKPPGFTGHSPGGLSRWSTKRSMEWEPLQPKLVVEVSYDHFTNRRFRHGTSLIRWRPDKAPDQCRMDQVAKTGVGSMALLQ
jgi:ATP-dependent DNA ligase